MMGEEEMAVQNIQRIHVIAQIDDKIVTGFGTTEWNDAEW